MLEQLQRRINLYHLMQDANDLRKHIEKEFGTQDPNDPDSIRVEITPTGIIIIDPRESEHKLKQGIWSTDKEAKRVRDSSRSKG